MFELIFLFLCLVLVAGLVRWIVFLVRGGRGHASRLLLRLASVAAVYMAIVILSSLAIPRQEYSIGQPQCFDDWCITVTSAEWVGAAPSRRYVVGISLTNRAQRKPMGEKGTVGFLTDASKRRYDPIPMPTDIPYDTRVQPGQTINTSRTFEAPPDAKGLGFVYTHEGGFPIDWLIIGGGRWFQEPPVVRLQR